MLDDLLEVLEEGLHVASNNLIQVLKGLLLGDGAAVAGLDLEGVPKRQLSPPLPSLLDVPVHNEIARRPIVQLHGKWTNQLYRGGRPTLRKPCQSHPKLPSVDNQAARGPNMQLQAKGAMGAFPNMQDYQDLRIRVRIPRSTLRSRLAAAFMSQADDALMLEHI